jgi:HK97 family phage prohead protease
MAQDTKFLNAKVKKEGGRLSVIVSDETLDRHGEVIPIETWDLGHFSNSPRMLVDHNHEVEKIVGRWENPNVNYEEKKLIMDAVFHDFTPLARATKEMVENGFLDTVSVGFIPHGPKEDGGKPWNELIEVSWVTVPANPNARILKELMAKSVGEKELNQVKDFVGEEETAPEDEEETAPEDEEEIALDVPEEKIIHTLEEYKEFRTTAGETKAVLVSLALMDGLCEKLLTLTTGEEKTPKKGRSLTEDRRIHLAIKEASRVINQALYQYNKNFKS